MNIIYILHMWYRCKYPALLAQQQETVFPIVESHAVRPPWKASWQYAFKYKMYRLVTQKFHFWVFLLRRLQEGHSGLCVKMFPFESLKQRDCRSRCSLQDWWCSCAVPPQLLEEMPGQGGHCDSLTMEFTTFLLPQDSLSFLVCFSSSSHVLLS